MSTNIYKENKIDITEYRIENPEQIIEIRNTECRIDNKENRIQITDNR